MAAEGMTEEEILAERKARALKRFQFKGIELERLLEMPPPELIKLLPSRVRRRISRMGSKSTVPAMIEYNYKRRRFMQKVKKAKAECGPLDKPKMVKTHLRNMIIVPQMIGAVIGVHNGKAWAVVDIKPEMIGRYLGEFSFTYKPTLHSRPGLAATHTTRFIPLHN